MCGCGVIVVVWLYCMLWMCVWSEIDVCGGGVYGVDDARRRVRMEDERRADSKRNEYKVIVIIIK